MIEIKKVKIPPSRKFMEIIYEERIKPVERWIRGSGKKVKIRKRKIVERIYAPAYDREINLSLIVHKKLFDLFEFKYEEKDDLAIPEIAIEEFYRKVWDPQILSKINNPLPTKVLFAHSSPIYPDLRIKCVYIGKSYFKYYHEGGGEVVWENFLTDFKAMYPKAFSDFMKTKDISAIEKVYNEYFGLPEKVERKAVEEVKEVKEIIPEKTEPKEEIIPKKKREHHPKKIVPKKPKIKPKEKIILFEEIEKRVKSYDFDRFKDFPLWWAKEKYEQKYSKANGEKKKELTELLYKLIEKKITTEEYHKILDSI